MTGQPDLVTTVNGRDGTLTVTYLGPVGLRGGRYRLTSRQLTDGKQTSITVDLISLVILVRDLEDELERARTGAARPT